MIFFNKEKEIYNQINNYDKINNKVNKRSEENNYLNNFDSKNISLNSLKKNKSNVVNNSFDFKLQFHTKNNSMNDLHNDNLINDFYNKDIKNQKNIIEEALNQNMIILQPKFITDLISNNLEHSKNILGEKLIELLTERSFKEIKSNLMIPEFKDELKNKIKSKIKDLKINKFLDNNYALTQKSFDLTQIKLNAESINSSFSIFNDNKTKGIGSKYYEGVDSKRINLKKTIRYRIRTNKTKIFYNKNIKHEKTLILFALDISASMRKRFNLAKKFIINFILKNKKFDYSYILFSNYAKVIEPTHDISLLIKNLNIQPNQRTNLYDAILKSIEIIENNKKYSKYFLFIVSDIKPNIDEDKILEALHKALNKKLEIFFIAVNPDKFSKKYIDEFIKINVNFFELRKTLKRIR